MWEEIKRLIWKVGDRLEPLDRESQFSPKILNEELPIDFRQPTIRNYDGRMDPEEHLGKFENAVMLYRYSDGVKCRVFLTILVDQPKNGSLFYNPNLPGASVTSNAFMNQYARSKKYLKTSLGLFNTKQNVVGSLREFIQCLNSDALEVPVATTDTLVNAFTHGLRGGDF